MQIIAQSILFFKDFNKFLQEFLIFSKKTQKIEPFKARKKQEYRTQRKSPGATLKACAISICQFSST